MICIIVVYLHPPFYQPFCFNSVIDLLRAHAPARRRHVNAGCVWIARFYTEGNASKLFQTSIRKKYFNISECHPHKNR